MPAARAAISIRASSALAGLSTCAERASRAGAAALQGALAAQVDEPPPRHGSEHNVPRNSDSASDCVKKRIGGGRSE
jgi:hypothetical protein